METTRPYATPIAHFSDCGSFCFLTLGGLEIAILSSVLLEERQAKPQVPAVWGERTSHNGQLYRLTGDGDGTMIQLRQAIDLLHRNGLRDDVDVERAPEHKISVTITPTLRHLYPAQEYLLASENSRDTARILCLPYEGPPHIKHLCVAMDQILAKMDEAAREAAPRIEELFKREFDETLKDESNVREAEEGSVPVNDDDHASDDAQE